MPQHVTAIFASLATSPERNAVGAVIFALDDRGVHPWKLAVLDWSLCQLQLLGNWIPRLRSRIATLADECQAQWLGDGILLEPGAPGRFLQAALAECEHESNEIMPDALGALDLMALTIGARTYVSHGAVKVSDYASSKQQDFQGITRNHFQAQLESVGLSGKDPEATELLRAWALGVLKTLDPIYE